MPVVESKVVLWRSGRSIHYENGRLHSVLSRATSIGGYLDILNFHLPVGLHLPSSLPVRWWTGTPPTGSVLNPDAAVEGHSSWFVNAVQPVFPEPARHLVSNNADFVAPYCLRAALQHTIGRDLVDHATSTPMIGNAVGPFGAMG
jgi:hypothetical protein